MDGDKDGIDPRKIQTVRDCLEKQFADVKFSHNIRPTFSFKNVDRKLSWLLVINAEFLTDRMSLDELHQFIEEKVLKKIHANPGKRIQISKYRDITVEEKNLS